MSENNLKAQSEEVKKKIKGMGPLKLAILSIMLVGTIFSYIFHDFFFAADSVFAIGVNNADGTPKSTLLNSLLAIVPGVIKAVQVVTIVLLVTTVVMFALARIFKRNQREITVIRLINNLIRVIVAVVLVISVLSIWGVDTTALITGAGVVTLVVGLGMQSLISDVVAGLFIVFENEFNVGDIITIDDFRGTVVSIGIRTTKLEALGNIKIINNSDIRGVLNQTVKPSTAKSLIDVEYGESLSHVDEVIRQKLPEIKIEGITGDISYDGVAELGASGVTLQFTASCYEGDIFAVQREMNKQLKNMFDANGIGIPFPQLVVHTAQDAVSQNVAENTGKKD